MEGGGVSEKVAGGTVTELTVFLLSSTSPPKIQAPKALPRMWVLVFPLSLLKETE